MVSRIYVEKKPGFDVEAQQLTAELRSILQLEALKNVRLINRYDVEGISTELFERCVPTVFSEPQSDTTYTELPEANGAAVFAVEYLPGQFDQRADSASECIQLISQGERPDVLSAKVYYLEGDLTDAQVEEVKHYIINPIEAREASLSTRDTVKMVYPEPQPVEVIDGFTELDDAGLQAFIAKRGLAISIALSGSGFGGAILSPIVSSLIVSVGWRSAFLVLAAVCMVAALPITAYSFRTKPSEIGLKPLGENPDDPSVSTAGDKDEHTAPEVSVGWSRIKKSPAFWLLVVAFLFMGLVNGAILPNQVTNMTSVTVNGAKIVTGGHDPMWAGTVLSAYMVTVVIAKISLGAIYDRFGNVLGSVACIVACVALCFPATDLGPIVAAVSFGVGTCMGTITPTIAASKQFGMADLGKVTGTITSLEMVGGTVGAIVSGVLFDATGSFASTWIVCLACSVVMLVFLLVSEPIAAKLRASVAGE